MCFKKAVRKFGTALLVCTMLLGSVAAVSAEEPQAPEETIWLDVSDMVYQAGGWGTPAGIDDGISAYAVTGREELKAKILEVLKDRGRSLQVEEYTGYNLTAEDEEELKIMFAEVLNENLELFFVKPTVQLSMLSGNVVDTQVTMWFYYYDYTADEQEALMQKLEEAISLVEPDMSDETKALVLHDYLAQHCAYAYEEYLAGALSSASHVYDLFGALVDGKAVCQGYAAAYSKLLNAVGVPCETCTSDAMNHAWNVVQIDGEWYHVDVTWDDPVWNTEGRAMHEYFLLSDAEMANREHHDWTDQVDCVSARYDEAYWWREVDSQIVCSDKRYYIVPSSEGIQLIERNGDETASRYDQEAIWKVWNDSNRYWRNRFSYLSYQGGYLYFNDMLNLYAMKTDDTEPQTIYTYTAGDGYIYGAMVYEDGTAHLSIDTSPNRSSDSYIVVDLKAAAPEIVPDQEAKTLSVTSSMEYSLDGGATWSGCGDGMSYENFGWDGKKAVEVLFRTAAQNGMFASEVVKITLPGENGGSEPIVTPEPTVTPEPIVTPEPTTTPMPIENTHSVIASAGNEEDAITIQLCATSGAVIGTVVLTGTNAEFVLPDDAAGTLILHLTKKNHVPRDYTITVGEALPQDMELHLIGDVTGDGKVTAIDSKLLYNHIKGAEGAELTDYDLAVGDVSGDGKITSIDKKMLYNHIKNQEQASLWE